VNRSCYGAAVLGFAAVLDHERLQVTGSAYAVTGAAQTHLLKLGAGGTINLA